MTTAIRSELHQLIDQLPEPQLVEMKAWVKQKFNGTTLQRSSTNGATHTAPEPINSHADLEQSDQPFIEGLTYRQFFALPDEEKNRVWQDSLANQPKRSPEELRAAMEAFIASFQQTSPLMALTQEEITARLQQTREEYWETY